MVTHPASKTVTRHDVTRRGFVGDLICHRYRRDRSSDVTFNLEMVRRKALSVCDAGFWGPPYHSVRWGTACTIKLQLKCVLTFRPTRTRGTRRGLRSHRSRAPVGFGVRRQGASLGDCPNPVR